ncbi:hypothetical protein M422DRAFT_97065, partial [Sphaerobolus stellatus SS14]
MTSRVLNRRQARWSMFLGEFNFRLDYLPGAKNLSDPTSRRPNFAPQEGDDVVKIQRKSLLTSKHTSRIYPTSDASSDTPTISAIATFTFDSSTHSDQFKQAFREDVEWRDAIAEGNEEFTVEAELVFHKGKLYVPQALRDETIRSRHDACIGGHPGRARTTELLEHNYSWPGMRRYIRRYVDTCIPCQLSKNPRHK